jgi:alpha,alpha-trehalase
MRAKFGVNGDLVSFLDDAYQVLNKEYNWWMNIDNGHTVIIRDSFVLNRYYSENSTPRPESYKEDSETANSANEDKFEIYTYIRAGAESGWDFSSRWIREMQGNYSLVDIRCSEIVPVDLNSIFYRFELNLEILAEELADLKQQNIYNNSIRASYSTLRNDIERFRLASVSSAGHSGR